MPENKEHQNMNKNNEPERGTKTGAKRDEDIEQENVAQATVEGLGDRPESSPEEKE